MPENFHENWYIKVLSDHFSQINSHILINLIKFVFKYKNPEVFNPGNFMKFPTQSIVSKKYYLKFKLTFSNNGISLLLSL